MAAPKDERVLPTWELLQRAKSEPITDGLIADVKGELLNASSHWQAVQADKKMRVNEGQGYAALRGIWALDAMQAITDRLVEEELAEPVVEVDIQKEGESIFKPKNNPTGIKAPKCPRCKRGA